MELLKQPQYSPVSVEKQVAMIYLGTKGLLRNVPVENVREFESMFSGFCRAKKCQTYLRTCVKENW